MKAVESGQGDPRHSPSEGPLPAVLQATQAVTSSLELEQVLRTIVREAARVSGTSVVRLFLLDEGGRVLRCRVGVGLPLEAERDLAIPVGESFSGQVAATGAPLAVADCRKDPRLRHPEHATKYGLVSYLGLPVKLANRVIGVLVFNTAAPRGYKAEEIALLSAFAQQSALAIQNAHLYQQEQVRRRQMEAVRAIGEEITRELDLSTLLHLIHERATALVGAVAGAVFLWDEADQVLVPRAWSGLGDWVAQVRLRPGEGLAGTAAQRREGMIDNEYRLSPYASPILLERSHVVAILAEPLLYQGRLVGVITIHHEGPCRHFTEADQTLVRLFAAQAAIAIENARLHGGAVRRGEELDAVLRATRSVMAGLDLRETLDRILKEASHIARTPHVKVVLVDREDQVLRLAALAGRPTTLLEGFQLPMGIGHSGIVAATGKPLFVEDCPNDPRNPYADQDRELGLVTYLGLPISIRGEVLGVLTFNTEETRHYSPGEIAYLTSFADMAAIAIENARLFAEVKRGNQELQALFTVSNTVSRSLDITSITQAALLTTIEALHVDAGRLYIFDEKDRVLRLAAHRGLPPEVLKDFECYAPGQGIIGRIFQEGQPISFADITTDPKHAAMARSKLGVQLGFRSAAGLPILIQGKSVGVIYVFGRAVRQFNRQDLALLSAIGGQVGIAIENARLYDMIRQHAATLEVRVRERTAELERALQVKSQFLANMSHELRTPLNFVLGFAEILREGTAGPLTPKQAGYVERIQAGGKRLLKLVTDLLEMAEADIGPASFRPDRLVLKELLEEVLSPLAATARAKSVALETALHSGLPVVVADRRKLAQILHHLLTNALRFTPTGGRVTVSAQRVSTAQGEEAELAVQDTGIGIRSEDLERIFLPFEQADGSDTRQYGGAGLGLALARQLTELHGGRIWAESEGEGRGARFILRLPLLPAPPPPQILVVEDEVFVREALRTALMADGYRVEGASSGIEALERSAAGPTDLIVLDVGLPDMDGRDLLKQLRADARTRDLPILVLTGLNSVQPDQVLSLGADEFLSKPVSPQVLSATVARLLRRSSRGIRGGGSGASPVAQENLDGRS